MFHQSVRLAALPAALLLCFASKGFAADVAQQLPEITISAAAGARDDASAAITATKSDVPLLETPMAVQTVSRETMDAQRVVTVKDAVKNVSGAMGSGYDYYDFLQIRGFSNGYASNYHNGLPLEAITGLETALLDRVEVVKGPASILYGRIEPGGLVNLVYKRPQREIASQVEQQVGQYGLLRTVGDVTGRLSEDGQWAYRLVGAYTQADSFMDFVEKRNIVGAAFLSWKPNTRFDFNVRIEGQRNRFVDTEDIGIPFLGGKPVSGVPRSRFLGDLASTELLNGPTRGLIGFDWTYQFSPEWKLTQRFHWDKRDEQQFTLWFNGFDGVSLVDRGVWFVQAERETIATNLDLAGDFNMGGMRHRVLLGVDGYRFTQDWDDGVSRADPIITPIDIFNPVYGGFTAAQVRAMPKDFFYTNHDQWYGVYAQDQISLGERWELLLGGRYDWAKTGNSFSALSLADAKSALSLEQDKQFSPRAGLLYKLDKTLSLYGSYSESFGSNNGRSASGTAFAPETGKQYELGVKFASRKSDLTASLSIFHLVKNNKLTDDPSTPDPNDQIALGQVRNRGLEIDVSGHLTPHWNIVANYAFSNTRITRDNSGLEGNEMPNVPRHAANLWANWEASPGGTGWLGGAGVYLVDARYADDTNTGRLPGYGRVDAMLGYRFKAAGKLVTAKLNVNNVFDTHYYDRGKYGHAKYGEPRTATASIRFDF